ncbi:hypothetical protein SAMN05428985_11088 [Nocardioides sp. YR527]|uniref:hypothetical protein n=1 Tax=Nocardioides sp. YR527 TaxID=1881028 RepID=UPI000885888F|nr:hypothetical protein [Nocardioides sp. YR527]SDL15455.1 hypothetical protein SAMN05428985_11088 [Nocardioides sp. YR527]
MENTPDRLDRRTVEHSDLTAAQRSTRARAAALARWGKTTDRAEQTAAAREAFLGKFPNETAMRGHMASLSFKASRAS